MIFTTWLGKLPLRQLKTGLAEMCIRDRLKGDHFFFDCVLEILLSGVCTVSYTHLDVYKRQKYAPPGASNDPRGLNSHWVKGVSEYYFQLCIRDRDRDEARQIATRTIQKWSKLGAYDGNEEYIRAVVMDKLDSRCV